MRVPILHPDYALLWTPDETTLESKQNVLYLNEPFMNRQVEMDSEYYLSIAVVGYADPLVSDGEINGQSVPLNYAFLPLYPFLMRLVAFPLRLFSLTPIAAAALAGVIVSVLGTLGGMVALYDLARDELDEAGGMRAIFYLLIFPAGFFLAMVYTEGLFVGLAFGSLALLHRRRTLWAVLLAVLATWTRAVGVALVIPLAVAYLRSGEWRRLNLRPEGLKRLALGLLTLVPLAAFLAWRLSPLGRMFRLVEDTYFGRGFLVIGESLRGWRDMFYLLTRISPQMTAYYLVEIVATVLGLVACGFTFRRHPEVALFSLAVILLSLTSGYPQGMHRYVMTTPSLFLFLARLGRNKTFDYGWTLASTLVMGVMALMFAADMWAG
jgi:hypothetical protein